MFVGYFKQYEAHLKSIGKYGQPLILLPVIGLYNNRLRTLLIKVKVCVKIHYIRQLVHLPGINSITGNYPVGGPAYKHVIILL